MRDILRIALRKEEKFDHIMVLFFYFFRLSLTWYCNCSQMMWDSEKSLTSAQMVIKLIVRITMSNMTTGLFFRQST